MLRNIQIIFAALLTGCAYYPNQDYVHYEGVVYDEINKSYYSWTERKTTKSDKVFYFSIGMKTLNKYNRDRKAITDKITKEIVTKEGYCQNGYKTSYSETNLTGDMGFGWYVYCN